MRETTAAQCPIHPLETQPCPAADPIADLCMQIRAFLADAPKEMPHEGYRYGELLSFAADALEAAQADAARYRWLRGGAPSHSERWSRWNLQRWDGSSWHSLERTALDAAIDTAMKGEGDGATAAQADAPPAPCARRYALAECRDIQANVMDRAQSWLNAADERGINVTDENGYLAVIRDMMLEVVRLNERIAYLEPIFIAARNLTDNAEEWECDGLGLWAQHGWWEPLHDALDLDSENAA